MIFKLEDLCPLLPSSKRRLHILFGFSEKNLLMYYIRRVIQKHSLNCFNFSFYSTMISIEIQYINGKMEKKGKIKKGKGLDYSQEGENPRF